MARYLINKQVYGLPPGYKKLEYIRSTGTQYINTGIKLASTDIIMTRFKNTSASGAGALYGIFKSGESSTLYANGTYYCYNSSNTKVNTNISVDTNWHESVHAFQYGVLAIDNTYTEFEPFTFTNTSNSPLFARIYNSAVGYYFQGDIAYWKVYRNDELYMDLVPCISPNNEVGMYDMVNGDFYGNSGSGSFITGPEVTFTQQYCVAKLGMRYIVKKEVS